MKSLFRFAWVLACATIAFACLSGAAEARKAHEPAASNLPVVRGSQYLALGDSVTFGYMEPQVVPAPDYPNASSFVAYPELVASALHLQLANAACAGETSSSFVNPTAPSYGCENNPTGSSANYRTNYPLHVSYTGSQLAYAVSYLRSHHKVRLVSLMIGADDFYRCIATTSDQCTSATEQLTTAGTITSNIAKMLSAIRKQGHYRGQIVALDYYSLNYASQTIAHQSLLLDGIENSAAQGFHVKLADGFGAFGAASVHSGGDPCAAGLLNQLSTGGCGVHPSYSGQAVLAHALEKAIKNG